MCNDLAVIVTSYNLEKEIECCLKSLKAQTIKNAQFIIVDDGSTDKTKEIIINFLQKNNDTRFKFYSKVNEGISDARNFGINKATAKYIIFVDGDDELKENDFLINIVNCMKNNDLDVLEYNFVQSSNKIKDVFFENRETSKVITGEELLYQSIRNSRYYSYVWHYIFNLEFIKKNNFYFESGIYIEDVLFMIPLLLKAKRTLYVNKVGYIYKQRANSITNNQDRNERIKLVKDHLFVLNKIKNVIDSAKLSKKNKIEFINIIFNAYFVNVIKAIGYNIKFNEIKTFNENELKKINYFKYIFLKMPNFILKPVCKLIIKIKN